MDNNRKLSSEELEALLNDVETDKREPRRTTVRKPKKKQTKIRFDMIIAAIVAVCLVVGIVFLVVHIAQEAGTRTSSGDSSLQCEKYPEISDVVKNYLNAYLISDSSTRKAQLAKYVDDMSDIDESDIKYNNYVTSYSEIECYTKPGPYDDTYIVYAYYKMTFKNIPTSVPAITTFYVIRDKDTKNVYIHNGVTDKVSDYIKDVTEDSDVHDLFDDVNKEYNAALKKDKSLRDFFDKLKNSQTKSTTSKTPATTKK